MDGATAQDRTAACTRCRSTCAVQEAGRVSVTTACWQTRSTSVQARPQNSCWSQAVALNEAMDAALFAKQQARLACVARK